MARNQDFGPRDVRTIKSILDDYVRTRSFVNPREPQQFKDAITNDTRLVFGETLGNPGIEVMDIPVIAEIAHEAGLPLMIDSTFTTPYLMNPIDHGADIIMHSLTKYMGGHGVAIGGVLIDSGRFDWVADAATAAR